MITIDEYQELAMRTAPKNLSPSDKVLNGLMGLNGEAGEAIDILKKTMFMGHPMDEKHMAKEIGDACWYIAMIADGLGMKLSDIFEMNIDKLRNRYPEGFSTEKSLNRKTGDI